METEVVALTLSTVAVTNAVPTKVPEVKVVVAVPETSVVNADSPKVPRVVVSVTAAPSTGIKSTVNTSTRMVAWLAPSFFIPAPPNNPLIPRTFPKLLGPVKSSTTAWQPKKIELAIINPSTSFLMFFIFFILFS